MQTRFVWNVVIIVFVAAVTGSFSFAQQEPELDAQAQIEKLQSERRDILRERVAVLDAMYKVGQIPVQQLVVGQEHLLEAELEIAKTKEQKLGLYKERLEYMRTLERLVHHQFEQGRGNSESKLWATAARLQAEIDLLRAQQ